MKHNTKGALLAIVALSAFLFFGYLGVTQKGYSKESVSDTSVLTATAVTSLNEFYHIRNERAFALEKFDLNGEVVAPNEYGILKDELAVDSSLLLETDEWKEISFGRNGLQVKYPTDSLYVQHRSEVLGQIILTSTESGEIEEAPFTKITIGEYRRSPEQSIFAWMNDPMRVDGEEEPPADKTVQYVTIGENTFLGSVFFRENLVFGVKNLYAEVSVDDIFAASLEVQNLEKGSAQEGEFDRIFYTILESLEVK